jgi:hypothetical protein
MRNRLKAAVAPRFDSHSDESVSHSNEDFSEKPLFPTDVPLCMERTIEPNYQPFARKQRVGRSNQTTCPHPTRNNNVGAKAPQIEPKTQRNVYLPPVREPNSPRMPILTPIGHAVTLLVTKARIANGFPLTVGLSFTA